MPSKVWAFLGTILATAETTVPIFIHNPQSQQIEGVIITQGNQLFVTLAQLFGTPTPAQGNTGLGSTVAPPAK